MRVARFLTLVVILFLIAATGWASAAPPSEATQRDQTRKELTSFFAGISDNAPGALGSIKKSPEAMAAVKSRIDSLSDAEVAEFSQFMREVPDWKSAPEMLARVLPAETLKKLEAEGSDFTARVPKAEKMRDDVRTLVATLKLLPDTKLEELGIGRAKLDEIDQSLQQLTTLQLAMLQRQVTRAGGWEQGAAAMNAIPRELRQGALALAKHGPITALDLVELEKYRARVTDVLKRVSALPESSRKAVSVGTLDGQAAQLSSASPDALFMLREQITPEKLGKLEESVSILERVAALTPAERDQLEQFRHELTGAFEQMAGSPDQARDIRAKLAGLGPEQVYLLKQGMPNFEQWKTTAPAMIQALSAPDLAQRITALQQPNPDPARVQELESFRAQALSYIEASSAEVEPALAARARQAVQAATLPKLEMIRSVTAAMPAEASASSRLQMVTNISLDCVVSLGSITIPVIDVSVGLGSIDFNWICDSIETAINAVAGQIQAAVDFATATLNNTINAVKSALESAIAAVVNTVDTLVAGIISTVTSIWNFVQTIPSLAWQAIQAALNALLDINLGDGITIRMVVNAAPGVMFQKMQDVLNLAGSWWTALGQVELPLIPCPPAGFHTPFGTVGDGAAVTNYNRYKFFIDKIIGLLPDTETSLAIKIPAQVVYAAYEFLGVCLQDAADDANELLSTNRHTEITGGQTLLGQQLAAALLSITGSLSTSTAGLTTLITNKSIDLTNLVNQRGDAQRDLDLRMQIELNLQAGEGRALALFQLPKANGGYLELARDIVNSAINAMLAAGQNVGQAQKMFAQAESDLGLGRFKAAYKNLQQAYMELSK
ncbi:MAG TPA: hypothetical protein VLV78_21620 [Thermoanaerobaculia bacterium]|nr:hypothetical protein [Thermoanaerobaculia bacterium]